MIGNAIAAVIVGWFFSWFGLDDIYRENMDVQYKDYYYLAWALLGAAGRLFYK